MKPPRILFWVGISAFALSSLLPIACVMLAPLWGSSTSPADGYGSLFIGRHLHLAVNSLTVAAGAALLALVFGVPFALLIGKTDLPGRSLFGALCVVPILIPPFVHAIVWSRLHEVIMRLTSLRIHSLWGAIWVLGLAYYPFVTLVTLSGLRSLDRNQEEAALLSHDQGRVLRSVTLPLTTPHILTGAIFVFVFSLMDFGVPDILRVSVYPVEIFVQFSAFYDEGAAAVLSMPLVVVAMTLMLLQRRLMGGRAYVSPSAGVSGAVTYSPRGGMIPGIAFCLLVLGLSIGVPVVMLVQGAGPFSNYLRVLMTSVDQLFLSFALAATAALATVVLATLLAYLILRSTGWRSSILATGIFIPFVVPATSMGVGLIEVWNRPVLDTVYSSPLIIIIGYLSRFLPFAVVTVHAGIKRIDRRLEEVASLAVSGWTRVMRRVVVPMLWPSILSGFFIVFILSLGELGTTLLVIPPGNETLPIKVYNLMHYGAEQLVAALCLIMTAANMLAAGVLLLFLRRTRAARLRSIDGHY